MRSYWLCLFIVTSSSACFGQITFKKGYFIDSSGNKTECFIKDSDWKNSPSSFNYKLTEPGEVEKMETKNVSEFAMGDTRYVQANVRYDQSSQELKKLGITSNPDWIQANLILKVIVEGKSILYQYTDPDRTLFFLSVNESSIEQLVFKSYLNPADVNQVASNNLYLSQLNSRMNCGKKVANSKSVPYTLRSLEKFFIDYNICSGDVVKEAPKATRSLSIRLTPGVDFAKVTGLRGTRFYDFGANTSFRMGAEFQFTLPFQHGKWAIVAEPTYQSFESTKDGGLKYRDFELPVGVRHKFFLSEKSYIFINAAAVLDFTLNHVQKIGSSELKVDGGIFGFDAGAGYSYGRFSLEGRYYPQRERNIANVVGYHYTKSTVILGFRVF